MSKGNHVFNHFHKTVENAFKALIAEAPLTKPPGVTIHLAAARAASSSPDAVALATRLPKAWPKFKEIVDAPPFATWDEMQDAEAVGADDPNSQLYGVAAKGFADEIKKIALPAYRSAARPGFYWSQMVDAGFDAEAAERWIGAHASSRAARSARIDQTRLWIRGPLTALVNTWIQYLKLDMDYKK